MKKQNFEVIAKWDADAKVWYVAESDLPGLSTEAPSKRGLLKNIGAIAPDLIELNDHLINGGGAHSVPVNIAFRHDERLMVATG